MICPEHWHHGLPWIVAHRGGAGEGGWENTLPAFRNAIVAGSDMLECDLQVTRDGELVLSHDSQVEGGRGHATAIAALNYSALPLFHPVLGWRPPDDRARTNDHLWSTFPRLADLLSLLVAPLHLSLEWKPYRTRGIERLVGAIQHHPLRDRIILGSVWQSPIRLARQLQPDLLTYATQRETVFFLLHQLLGWTGRHYPFQALALPVTYRGFPLVSEKLVQFAVQNHLLVHVWTVNERGLMGQMLAIGVQALITDYPKLALAERRLLLHR